MDTRRQQKVSKVILQDLADIFQKESQAMFNGAFITVTIVRVSADLSSARVFLSIMGKNAEEIMLLVNKQNKLIRKDLAARVRHQLRKVPELLFHVDDSLDYYEEINDLLKD
jgi:ribosome-binding factor A